MSWSTAASGLAAVWARENTREDLFDAMQNKETYGAAGPRITLPLVGNTVDIANANWTNTIGESGLISVWTDPEFGPKFSVRRQSRFDFPTHLSQQTANHQRIATVVAFANK